ncbi:alpha/beta fold hydrolase [Hymenobacter lutimineralis]|uniref:Alpha/beta fold hydrolase n=1 Tax=Hymenobacter lutimineralis TaxID=2606448 RepID=A0A5D6VBC8_9BACT|nr:alpha/beta hydrolase-fold protein [Hymenobacter lutimineralis]TYZ12640.1 alpha/beta fold hydrolase [Hymenobacter lutimineralis]
MKLLFLLCLLVGSSLVQAQTVKNNAIVIGRVDSVTSVVLKEKRTLWVYVPASATDPTYLKQRYPVVYLLDGDAWFTTTTGVLQKLSEFPNSVCPEMIVVGIPNTNRTRDLTPSTSTTDTDVLPAAVLKTAGGGEHFTAFLEKELIPYIDAHYPTTTHRTLIGHSFGGLLVLNTLVHHPDLFENYVAIDPSLFWDQEKLLKQAHEALEQPRFAGRALFVASANNTGLDSVRVLRDVSVGGALTRSQWKLRDELARNRRNGLRSAYKYYSTDTHNTVPLLATYDALHFLFSAYALLPAATSDLFNPASKADQAALLEAHYRQVSAQAGHVVLPPESAVNALAYYLLSQPGKAARSLALFQLNVRNYPTSFNVHDSLGDYYQSQGQPALAIASYSKALQLKEFPETRQKLTKLQAKK